MNNYYKASIFILIILMTGCSYNIQNSGKTNKTDNAYVASNITNASVYNFEAKVLGIICSAHNFNVNFANDLDAQLSNIATNKQVIADSAYGTIKCIADNINRGYRCEATLNTTGSIISDNGNKKPFNITKSDIKTASTCGDAANAMSIASNDTANEIIALTKSF